MNLLHSFVECFDYLSTLNSVIECGVGDGRKLKDIKCPVRIGIDAFPNCLERVIKSDPHIIPICYDLSLGLDKLFMKNSVDAICFFDVIEHFEKDMALDILQQAEEIAKIAVVSFVPVGNHPQVKDDRGMGNDHYQTHRSTWNPQDMIDLGHLVVHHENFHNVPGKDSGAMFCVKYLSK